MSLSRPFTIIFCEWKATDTQRFFQDTSQGYVCRFSHEWANIQYAFIISILTKCCSTRIGKKTSSEREKCLAKMALFFAFWRTYGTEYLILGVPYVLGILYAKTFFPVAKVWIKRSFFRPFSCIYPLRSPWPKLKIEILHQFFKYNSQ